MDNIQKTDYFNRTLDLKNRARQLRTESVIGFAFIRNDQFPCTDDYSPYIVLKDLDVGRRKQFGLEIYEQVLNYLRMLGVHNVFLKESLPHQIIVRIQNEKLTGVQLIPRFLTRKIPESKQIVELRNFLFQENETVSIQMMDALFPKEQVTISVSPTVNDVVKHVTSIDDIKVVEMGGIVFLCDGEILSTQKIFEAKVGSYVNSSSQDNQNLPLFVILSRFINEHQAIQSLNKVPVWLNDYVKYDNPTPLPKQFINMCNCKFSPLEMLRICLGMNPIKPQQFNENYGSVPESIKKSVQELPVWFQNKIQQFGYLADTFVDDQTIDNGVKMGCEANVNSIINFCMKRE